jgi:hypothetical protein
MDNIIMYQEGGARTKEWYCNIVVHSESNQKIPMYMNSRTGEKYPIFLNRNGKLSYRDKNGNTKLATNCVEPAIIHLLRNPVVANAPVHGAATHDDSNKKQNIILPLKQYIALVKQDKPLPNTKRTKLLRNFCRAATRKKIFTPTPTPVRANTPTPVRANTPTPVRANTPTPVRANTPTPVRANTPTPVRANTPTPVRAKPPTPVRAKTPTPVRANTPTPVRANTPTPVRAKTPTPVRANTSGLGAFASERAAVVVAAPRLSSSYLREFARTRSPIKQRCDGGQRCKKGTRCNKRSGYCVKTGAKQKTVRRKSSVLRSKREKESGLDIMQAKESYKELGITEKDYFDDVCLVLRNIRKKMHSSYQPDKKMLEWSKDKMFKLHELSPMVTKETGVIIKGKTVLNRNLYLGPHLIRATGVIGEGGFGKIYAGTFGHKKCAIKQSLEPMTHRSTIIDYYTEIIIQNELFCHAHRQALSRPKYAKIPKPYFMARLDKTPLLGMEPLDDSLYNFIKKSKSEFRRLPDAGTKKLYQIKMTTVIADMFECLCNTLILLQDKYEFYHRDMHAGNIMYRKQGESYQWFLIDFGFATFKMNDYRFNWEGAGPYGPFNSKAISEGKGKGRVGHDLRLTLLYIFELVDNQFNRILLPDAFNELNLFYRAYIQKPIIKNKIGSSSNFWHRGYADAFDNLVTKETEPKVFLAETIPNLRGVIEIERRNLQLSSKKSSRKTRKHYVHVERKEGKLHY